MLTALLNACKNVIHRVKKHLKQWTKLAAVKISIDAISDLPRKRADLIFENAFLRQQLIVLNRQVNRPQLTNGDRLLLVFLARFTRFWQSALHIIQPETLLRWHRDLFRLLSWQPWSSVRKSG